MDEIRNITWEQIEFDYDTWKLGTKYEKVDFFDSERKNIPTISTR
jgi:hypothetical protein